MSGGFLIWVLGIGVLVALITFIAVLFRALVLFPWWAEEIGFRAAARRYKYSVVPTAALLVYMAVNLTGFSWSRMHWVAHEEMIDAAIGYHYAGAYKNAEELRADYPDFDPAARFWGSWRRSGQGNSVLGAALGHGNYEVRLPDAIVHMNGDGRRIGSVIGVIHCGDEVCESYAPRAPQFGVVGVVTYVNESAPIQKYDLEWEIPGGVRGSYGDCFYAYHAQANDIALTLRAEGNEPVQINKRYRHHHATLYGFYLMKVEFPRPSDPPGRERLTHVRISPKQFREWMQCDPAHRRDWPYTIRN